LKARTATAPGLWREIAERRVLAQPGKSAPRRPEINGLQFFRGAATLGGSTTLMKKLIILALVLVAGSFLFTSCTSVPQDKPHPNTTTVPQDNK